MTIHNYLWSTVDSPVLDIYNFYKKEALHLEFGSILREYFKTSPMEEEEKQLLFILLCMPNEVTFKENEFTIIYDDFHI